MSSLDRLSDGADRIDDLADDALDEPDPIVQAEATERIEDGASSLLARTRSAIATAAAFIKSALVTAASVAWSATTTAVTAVRNGLGVALATIATFVRNNEKRLVILSIIATVLVVTAYLVSERDVEIPRSDD